MHLSPDVLPRPAQHYRLPALLHDIRLFDLLELSGSTQEASRVSGVSQPTISRRTRLLAHDFALAANRRQLVGCRYGTNPALRLLRLGCRAHRLMAGVARLGADVFLQPLLAGCSLLLPAPPRFRPVESWLELVREGVLDGALVSGLEFQGEAPAPTPELELLALGAVPLALATGAAAATGANAAPPDAPTVLLPNRAVAQGLKRGLEQRGFAVKLAGNHCQSPAQWLQRLEQFPLAMPLPDLEPAHWWQPLRLQPLAQPLQLPFWLLLPAGWQEEPVLEHTARELRAHPALRKGEHP